MQQYQRVIPVLAIASGVTDFDFYKNAFDARENWRISNSNGAVHVAELSISGMLFRVHEQSEDNGNLSPSTAGFTSVTIVLEVEDVAYTMAKATMAGAAIISQATEYDYGYRQGTLKDPLGHFWQIEKLIDKNALEKFIDQAPGK